MWCSWSITKIYFKALLLRRLHMYSTCITLTVQSFGLVKWLADVNPGRDPAHLHHHHHHRLCTEHLIVPSRGAVFDIFPLIWYCEEQRTYLRCVFEPCRWDHFHTGVWCWDTRQATPQYIQHQMTLSMEMIAAVVSDRGNARPFCSPVKTCLHESVFASGDCHV